MTVSEKIIAEYLEKGESWEDVPSELKARLNENGIAKIYKAMVENELIEPVDFDDDPEKESDDKDTEENEEDAEDNKEDSEEDSEDDLDDDEPEEKKESKKPGNEKKKKSKFEDVWLTGKYK